jgi:hypothetical protein
MLAWRPDGPAAYDRVCAQIGMSQVKVGDEVTLVSSLGYLTGLIRLTD